MKMKICKRFIALALAAVCMLSLAACGGADKQAAKADAKAETAETATPEYVYAPAFTTLAENSESGFAALAMTDEGIYYADLEKVGDSTPEGVTPEYEGQYDINEVRLYFMDYSGKSKKLDAFAPLKSEIDSEGKRDYQSFAHPECATTDDSGNLIVLESIDTSWSDAPTQVSADSAEYFDYAASAQERYIRVLDPTGAELKRFRVELGEDAYIGNMVLDGGGNIVLSLAGTGSCICAYTLDGDKAYETPVDGYLYGAARMRSGDIAVMTYESGDGYIVRTVESATGALSAESYTIPLSATELVSCDASSGEHDLYYSSGASLCGYDMESGESSEVINWVECDVNGDTVTQLHLGADGIVRALTARGGKNDSVTVELVSLEKQPYSAAAEKTHLTLATLYGTYELRNAVADFNRSSDSYRVDIKDYYEMTGSTSYADALTKLTTELTAGEVPDILELTDLPYQQLAAKGLLEDLYPYIDGDGGLSRDDFFANILATYEVNGGLYAAVAGFGITTVMGASSVVGSTPGWTYDNYYAALSAMPEGCSGFDWYMTKETMLRYGLMVDLNAYIDWTRGECRFESEEFIKLLEFCNSFPSNKELESYESSEQDSAEYRISQGQQMLTVTSLYSFNETSSDNPFKTDVTYIGFPSATGSGGSAVSAIEMYAMTSACADKAAAWEFLRTFLTEEYQTGQTAFPTNKKAYSALRREAIRIEYETDDNGRYVLDADGNRKRKVIGMMYDGTTYSEIYSGMSEERAAAIDALIAAADKSAQMDTSIMDIAEEEAQAYFAGQKSAADVARLIQSKANIYINEQR